MLFYGIKGNKNDRLSHERTMVPPGYRLPLSLRTSAHAGVAIRFSLGTVRILIRCKGNGLPRRCAPRNDRWWTYPCCAKRSFTHCTCGRGAQRMCVYHPKCVTHLPRALPTKRSFIIPNSPGGTAALTKSIPRSCQMIPENFLAVFHKKIRRGQCRQQNLTPIFYNL